MPGYQESRLLDLRYQCSLSAKKCYILGRLHEWLYVEKRNVVIFVNWAQTGYDYELLLSTACITA